MTRMCGCVFVLFTGEIIFLFFPFLLSLTVHSHVPYCVSPFSHSFFSLLIPLFFFPPQLSTYFTLLTVKPTLTSVSTTSHIFVPSFWSHSFSVDVWFQAVFLFCYWLFWNSWSGRKQYDSPLQPSRRVRSPLLVSQPEVLNRRGTVHWE